ncbi:MAG: hypothetical protein OQJ93_14045 [Ignavibacteriaceae bacterium]|jgi:uncharacterized membrane protein|nr:hypothetical protein [Ignavibacteriaceae bacterium]MCW8812111.1 hypothetical protein [Chlorobium sp.]MCW8817536.1 hypothetical protein [Ignavibacteriaceae bacterium]MCW8995121.1 hypothetical protein [Psychromonas sp.]MCW9098502.1 hypothetical protein [Ignavibacteriaceae bacterium]
MIQINDEILNKYLDGELSREEAEQVKSALRNSEELQRKFNALEFINDKLYDIKEEEVSPDFTNDLMKRILKNRFVVPKQQKYFIVSIASFITLLCLVIFGFSISAMISSSPSSIGESSSVVNSITYMSDGIVKLVEKVFSGQGLSIVGSIFSIIIIISGYFFFEMQKRAKANLGNGQQL